MKIIGVLTPMFCACVLMQRGTNKKLVRNHAKRDISSSLEIVFELSPLDEHKLVENELFLRRLFRTLDYADESIPYEDVRLHANRSQQEARDRLATSLAASDIVDYRIVKLRHLCRLGCHPTRKAAVDEISGDMIAAHLDMSVCVPAINRWLKLFAPAAYWLVAIVLGVVTRAFGTISETLDEKAEATVLSVDELIGIGEDSTYQSKKRVRFKKAYSWLCAPFSALRILVGFMLMDGGPTLTRHI